jgi:hypothetical protein
VARRASKVKRALKTRIATWQVRTAAIAVTLVVCLWLAGCGDVGAGTPSGADFMAKGNAICKRIFQRMSATGGASGDRLSPAESKRRFLAAIQGEIDALHVLGAPVGEEARVSAMLDSAQKGLDKANGDPTRLLKPGNPFTAYRRTAYLLGLTSCAFPF